MEQKQDPVPVEETVPVEESVTTFAQLQERFDSVLLLADRSVVRIVCAALIGHQCVSDAVWIMLVAGSGGGKSEILNSLYTLELPTGRPMTFLISDLTSNTMASGQKIQGQETSLLHKAMPGSFFCFKDFTSLLSKNQEARAEILGQLREIYDGEFVKRTGNNSDVVWKGHVGAFAACTEIIYQYENATSTMGARFMMYRIKQADRIDLAKAAIGNVGDMKEKRAMLQRSMKQYIESMLAELPDNIDIKVPEVVQDEIIHVSNLAANARSGVVTHQRTGAVEFVPDKEYPTRIAKQLMAMYIGMVAMQLNDTGRLNITPEDEPWRDEELLLEKEGLYAIYQIAFDSVDIRRRMVLQKLAQYSEGATTAGVATVLGYDTAVVKKWLFILNGLGVCDRIKRGHKGNDVWKIKEQFKHTVLKYENLSNQGTILSGLDEDESMESEKEGWEEYSSKQDRDKAETEYADELFKSF